MLKLFDPVIIGEGIPELLRYLPLTMEIVLISSFFSLSVGLLLAVIKIKGNKFLRTLANVYVSWVRGTPVLVQLYLSYYGIPIMLQYINYYFGKDYSISKMPNIIFVIVAFSLHEAAYTSETLRAAIQSVDKGQVEAALSIGLSYPEAFFSIIMPEAMIVALPSLANIFISLLKGTSLAFVCAVVEMTAASKLIASRNLRHFEMYIALSLIYWGVNIMFSYLFTGLEKKLKKSDRTPIEVEHKEVVGDAS